MATQRGGQATGQRRLGREVAAQEVGDGGVAQLVVLRDRGRRRRHDRDRRREAPQPAPHVQDGRRCEHIVGHLGQGRDGERDGAEVGVEQGSLAEDGDHPPPQDRIVGRLGADPGVEVAELGAADLGHPGARIGAHDGGDQAVGRLEAVTQRRGVGQVARCQGAQRGDDPGRGEGRSERFGPGPWR